MGLKLLNLGWRGEEKIDRYVKIRKSGLELTVILKSLFWWKGRGFL